MPKLYPLPVRLTADPARVVIRPFHIAVDPKGRASINLRRQRIIDAVLAMDMRTVQGELAIVNHDFEARHWQTRRVYLERYNLMAAEMDFRPGLREAQKELIGAYFCHEYSYAAAALMNPSVVPHIDQSGISPGNVRFIMSLRAVGEGHISSIAFREGILSADGSMSLLAEPPFAVAADGATPSFDSDNCTITCHRDDAVSLSGTVIFPFTRAQRNGIEDVRLVRFEPEGEAPRYYGTYTAYSGSGIASELLSTDDFRTFTLEPMYGSASVNKGMALFPKRVNGAYAMIGRQDGESLFFMQSDERRWDGGEKILAPIEPWELIQIGNCGSPMEIDEGWLLLTHGVGAMRQYSIGAVLLDKNDPRELLGRLQKPLLSPADEARAGYVPNVVYTCGGLVNGRMLFLPYGVADSSVAFCNVEIDALLAEMI